MTTQTDLQLIKHLCILNFLELQDIKRKLDIADDSTQDFCDYKNSLVKWIKELDEKRFAVLNALPPEHQD